MLWNEKRIEHLYTVNASRSFQAPHAHTKCNVRVILYRDLADLEALFSRAFEIPSLDVVVSWKVADR